jgi:glycine/D-amino acid oxidase-like deaminating enzyme
VAYSGADAAAVRDRVARKQAAGYPAELLDPNAAARVNPALARLADRPAAIAYFPSEGYIDTTTLIGHLLRPFPERTLPLLRTRVLSLVRDAAGTLTGVRTSTEGDIAAERVILCAGADTSLLRDAGFPLAARGPVGATVITAPVPARMTGLVHFPDVTVRPDGAGRLLLHADDIDARIDTGAGDTDGGALALAEDAVAELVARARTWLAIPGDDIAAAEVRASYRPYPPDGFPAVGPVPGLPGAFAVVTHSGVTLGAILGRLVAREVLRATADPLLAPYRLDRFR